MDKQSRDFLHNYLAAVAPVGQEADGQKIWLQYLKPYVDHFFTDIYGTAVGVLNPRASYKVVLEAHADEIAWYVNYVTDEGYLYVTRNGGSDYEIAPSMRAYIHTETRMVPAVFGWPAIHVRKKDDKTKPDVDTVVLDCGCSSAKEVEKMGIQVGCIVTFDAGFKAINDKFWTGRALDNRIGGFMIAEVARRIHDSGRKLPFGLYIVNAVQEEIGHRGAMMVAHRIQPHVAIITDVTHDTQSPLYKKTRDGDVACGKGPVINHAPSIQSNLRKMLVATAQKYRIAVQQAVNSRATGTDTDAFAYSRTGIASALISLPLKYMHTTVEMVHQKDVEKVIQLLYHFLIQLEADHDFSYVT